MMKIIIYALCTATSLTCAWLLLRSYARTHYRLLFWSGLCFVGASVNNILVILDRVVFPTSVDLLLWRLSAALIALLLLLFGLIWEED